MKFSLTSGQVQTVQSQCHAAADPAPLDVNMLYQKHAPFIGRVLMRFLGDSPHVDDILQETFIIAFEKRASFDPSRAAPSSWLYGIASNLCRHHKRKSGREGKFINRLEQEEIQSVPGPDSQLQQQQDIARVQSIIQKLPFKQREVFVLFEIEGLSGNDIASMLHIPLGTVWTRLHKARDGFKDRLTKQNKRGEQT